MSWASWFGKKFPTSRFTSTTPREDGGEPVYTTRFPRPLVDNIEPQLKEMVERYRNHPSIIIWGLADDLSRYQYPEDFVELSNAAHALDPTRWTAGRHLT